MALLGIFSLSYALINILMKYCKGLPQRLLARCYLNLKVKKVTFSYNLVIMVMDLS